MTPEEEAEQVREKISSDLKNWQEKFAKAADRGTEDLQERIKEITDRQIESQVLGVGEALVIQLEESSASEIAKVKKSTHKIIKSLPKELSETDVAKADDDLLKVIQSAGLAVKSKAQALRSWRQSLDEETQSLVGAASESTLEVIDNIRDLGLQEIGMRWAWMEGVTYKDWSKYSALKKTFDEWRNKVEAVAKDHVGLAKSREAGEDVESRGMLVAEETAKELSRLKEVCKWKIQAVDTSDDFSTRYIPAAAAGAGQRVLKKVNSASEQIIGSSKGSMESMVSQASQQVADAASSVTSQVVGTDLGAAEQAASKVSVVAYGSSEPMHASISNAASGKMDSASSKASEAVVFAQSKASEAGSDFVSSANEASTKASEIVVGTQQPTVDSIVSVASKKGDQAILRASEAIIGTPAPVHQSVASKALQSIESAASAISDGISRSSTTLTESDSSGSSSVSASASSIASKASKKVFSGAMAQKVGDRKPILDDIVSDEDLSYSEKMQSIVSQAGDKYTDITKAVSEALQKPTVSQGVGESATSLASEQYSSALAAASNALYGTQQGIGESVTSVASGRYAEAVAA